MAQQIEDIMTKEVERVHEDATVADVARLMRERDIGDVLVIDDDDELCGIVTDRDIVLRVVSAGHDPDETSVGDICSGDPTVLSPKSTIEEAVKLMRERAIRRVPVCADGKVVGIVTIGDLAQHQDPRSALADISKAAPNN
jgi:CBS domain-containing protein